MREPPATASILTGAILALGATAAAANLVLGCTAAPAPAPVETPEVAVSPAPAAPAEAPPPEIHRGQVVSPKPWCAPPRRDASASPACQAAVRAQKQLQARHKAPARPKDGSWLDAFGEPPPPVCAPTRGGAWALLFQVVEYRRNEVFEVMHRDCEEQRACLYDAVARMTIAHFSSTGARVDGPTFQTTSEHSRGWDDQALALHDFDGDGEEEAIVLATPASVLSFRGNAVKPYAAAEGIAFTALADQDADGRPDLVLVNPYRKTADAFIPCLMLGSARGLPHVDARVPLLAHALPDGRFSRDDAVARQPARALCPERPSKLVPRRADGTVDNPWLRENVVCARMWGTPAEQVTAALNKECAALEAEDHCSALASEVAGEAVKVCVDKDELLRWAALPPPVALTRDDAVAPEQEATDGCASGTAAVPGMAALPGGTFKMRGSSVSVKPFQLDLTEVTADAYAVCVRAGRCSASGLSCGKQATYGARGRGNHPINCVDWNQATAYCQWVGKRLPTTEEWEWAARGQERGWLHPWGDDKPAGQLCWNGDGNDLGQGKRRSTCPVGSYPAGDAPGGIHDLAGNVSEWTSSEHADRSFRVLRGGGWSSANPSSVRASEPSSSVPRERWEGLGFRCAR